MGCCLPLLGSISKWTTDSPCLAATGLVGTSSFRSDPNRSNSLIAVSNSAGVHTGIPKLLTSRFRGMFSALFRKTGVESRPISLRLLLRLFSLLSGSQSPMRGRFRLRVGSNLFGEYSRPTTPLTTTQRCWFRNQNKMYICISDLQHSQNAHNTLLGGGLS